MSIGSGVGVMGGASTPGFLGPQAESTPGIQVGAISVCTWNPPSITVKGRIILLGGMC